MVAYSTAYLKAYYPLQFMSALLTFEMGDTDKVVEYIDEARQMGIDVLPPDINSSGSDFTVVHENGKDLIRFGMAAVKGVGTKAVEAIIAAREKGGPFKSIYDFCNRVDLRALNRGVLESLIKCGAFDSTGDKRKAMCDALDDALQFGSGLQKDALAGQMSFFDNFDSQSTEPERKLPAIEWPEQDLLAYEKETLGFYVTSHPLSQHARLLTTYANADTRKLRDLDDGHEIVIGGLIEKIRTVLCKGRNGGEPRKMAVCTLEDLKGKVEFVLFPDDYDNLKDVVQPDTLVFVRGQVDRRREEPSVRASEVYPLALGPQFLTSDCLIHLNSIGLSPGVADQLRGLCKKFPGQSRLQFAIRTSEGHIVTICAGDHIRISPSPDFIAEVEKIIGPGHIKLIAGPIRNGSGRSNGNRFNRRKSAIAN